MPKTAPSKIFSLEEARRTLPLVRERTRRALEEMQALGGDGDGEPGSREDVLPVEAARILSAWATEMEDLGLAVKGPWLVDFDSGGGYYCWTWPEESLDYFHGYEEGFAGRMRLQ